MSIQNEVNEEDKKTVLIYIKYGLIGWFSIRIISLIFTHFFFLDLIHLNFS